MPEGIITASSMAGIFTAVLPVIGAVLMGALMRRLNWLTTEADTSLMRVTINVFTPCLIFDSVLGNAALANLSTLLLTPTVGFITVTAGILLALAVSRFTGLPPGTAQRTFALCTGIYNYGYIPLPLALMMFDRETVGVLFVHNIGVEAAMWSVGLLVISGQGLKSGWRQIVNVPLGAILLGLALNASGLAPHLPAFVRQTAHLLGQCAIPLGLVLVGATMADYAHEFRFGRLQPPILWACALRLGLLPVGFLLFACVLPAPVELKRIILLQAAMPAAVFPIIMSRHYGGDPGLALRIVLSTSLGALLTMPWWLRWGAQLLGLTSQPG
ncbi:MAG: AEC family transporter [Verrucomicrobiae bacterium]|nr:AEC family transporter [Verrucomicrobiae bacterium]